jgi:hypothetical protein
MAAVREGTWNSSVAVTPCTAWPALVDKRGRPYLYDPANRPHTRHWSRYPHASGRSILSIDRMRDIGLEISGIWSGTWRHSIRDAVCQVDWQESQG